MLFVPVLMKARRRSHLTPVKKTYMRDGKLVTGIVWTNPTQKETPGNFSLFEEGPVVKGSKEEKERLKGSQQFKRWFRNSKVVKRNGEPAENYNLEPLKVFHGTARGGFTEFKKPREWGIYGQGLYFTEDEEVAVEYTRKGSPKDDSSLALSKIANRIVDSSGNEVKITGEDIAAYEKMLIEQNRKLNGKYGVNPNSSPHVLAMKDAIGEKGVSLSDFRELFLTTELEESGVKRKPYNDSTLYQDLVEIRLVMGHRRGGEVRFERPEEKVYEVFLRAENPMDMDKVITPAEFDEFVKSMIGRFDPYIDDIFGMDEWDNVTGKDVSAKMEKYSYEDILRVKRKMRKEKYNVSQAETAWTHGWNAGDPVFPHMHLSGPDELTYGDLQYIFTNGQKNSVVYTKALQELGYDGIKHTGGWNIGTKQHTVWVVFDPTQIKSTKNSGNFDPDDPDIMKSGSRWITRLLKAGKRGKLIPVKKTYMRDGKMVTATVWMNPTDEKARGTLSLFADEVIKTPKKVVDIDHVFKEKEGNRGASGNKKKKEKSQGDLFVDAGMGEELKEQWREKKRNKHLDYLQEPWNEGKPRWMFTLKDYAELDTLGGKRLSDMSPKEIKKESGLHTMDLGKGKHNWSPSEEAPLQEHIDHLKYFINDLVDLYRETDGKYGKKGEMTHRRQIHQALRAGLPVPPEVLEEYRRDFQDTQDRASKIQDDVFRRLPVRTSEDMKGNTEEISITEWNKMKGYGSGDLIEQDGKYYALGTTGDGEKLWAEMNVVPLEEVKMTKWLKGKINKIISATSLMTYRHTLPLERRQYIDSLFSDPRVVEGYLAMLDQHNRGKDEILVASYEGAASRVHPVFGFYQRQKSGANGEQLFDMIAYRLLGMSTISRESIVDSFFHKPVQADLVIDVLEKLKESANERFGNGAMYLTSKMLKWYSDATDDYIAKIRGVVGHNQTISYDRETASLVGLDRLNEEAVKIFSSFWEKGGE